MSPVFVTSHLTRIRGNSSVSVDEVYITCGQYCASAGARHLTYTTLSVAVTQYLRARHMSVLVRTDWRFLLVTHAVHY